MRRLSIYMLILILPVSLLAGQTSIYDIQFTNNPGSDGTYPSPYRGQVVTTTGIVVAMDYLNGGFYISEPEGGAWRGIYVQDNNREVQVGDRVTINGEVAENFGFTVLRNINSLRINNSGNQIPNPYPVSTSELAQSEAYESVLVQVSNVSVVGSESQHDITVISDGSGNCRVNNTLLSLRDQRNNFHSSEIYSKIIGIIDYRYGEYRLNPRTFYDLVRSPVGAGKSSWGRIKFLYR